MVVIKRRKSAFAGVAVYGLALFSAWAALAQSTTPLTGPGGEPSLQALPADPPPSAVPARPAQPGLFGTVGRWMDDSIGNMTSGWNNARSAIGGWTGQAGEAAKGAAGAAKNAAANIGLSPTVIVTGHTRCVPSATGGPDCALAAELLCRSKKYSGGTSLHIQSEQKCPVWGWISGQKPVGKCGTETYVTSAMCR